ncbi:MAG: hypothetical protein B7O98_00825 [Zestosphaera tikiterensis]|uniref:Probable cobalamin biosynthesis protein CobD n=1 Tax=Zestosphaera tikiterensis TaxID=1973259 RepID=A0A2R7Y8W9_9CREN|nr:MAG: hypothetical protein B7O98_00825 [Zestosphaera tikiterensis]
MILPDFIYPSNPLLMFASILLAHILDYLYPYHSGFMLFIHPVHTSYVMARKLGKPYSSKVRGFIAWIVTVTTHLLFYILILYIAWNISMYLWVVIASYIMKTSFSLRLLLSIVKKALICVSRNDWNCCRYWVQQIVRRDVYQIDDEHVVSAAIESLAESLVDGYVSPLFYITMLGPIGGLLQRVVNTMDSALGYKDLKYVNVGWFSAKMDTVVNFIPARVAALLIIISSPVIGGSIKYSLNIWRIYRGVTESINAGNPMSAMAGALKVRLEKIGSYSIGEFVERLDDIAMMKALKISTFVALIWLLITVVLTVFLSTYV